MKSEQEISKKISVKLNMLHLMETSLVKLLDARKKNEIKKNISSLEKTSRWSAKIRRHCASLILEE